MPANTAKLAFVDVETSGGSATHDRIIEIGILRVEDGEVVRTYKTLVNGQTYVPAFIQQMTGIRESDLQEAPTFRDIMQEVYEILDGCVFVAHNVRFDYGFVRNEFRRYGHTFTSRLLCTAKLSRALFPHHTRHNLDIIMERFGITCENRHRAFDDALAMWEFYRKARDIVDPDLFTSVVTRVMKEPSIPRQISKEEIDELPEAPGVYTFYGDGELPLYIGKSTDIRERVLSHFSGDHTRSTEMEIAQQIKRIETVRTAGELGALLLESRMVKEMKPIFNRQLRAHEKIAVVTESIDPNGYRTHFVEELDEIDIDTLPTVVSVFKTKKQAKGFLEGITDEYGLCRRLTGVERTKGMCFGAKLGTCKGACDGMELPDIYNMRVEEAFAKHRLREWSYGGPIMVREEDAATGRTECFLIDQWCILGTVDESEATDIESLRYEYRFDYDVYKILKTHLTKRNAAIIRLGSRRKWVHDMS
jgi:DNA polymerase-3 subunit epsilon